MKIHEYQAKQLFQQHGIATPTGVVIQSADEAASKIAELDTAIYVVKAQIHAGGRGKGGGVKLAKSADEALAPAPSTLMNVTACLCFNHSLTA